FLEIAFAEKVRDLTRNAIPRYKHSVMGEREQLDVATEKDAGEGAFAVVELRRDVLDLRRDQEEMLILLEDETRRDELYQKIYDSVKDPHISRRSICSTLKPPRLRRPRPTSIQTSGKSAIGKTPRCTKYKSRSVWRAKKHVKP